MAEKLKIEYWPIEKFIQYARNPRNNDANVDRMAGAIKEFGFRIPIVAKSDGVIVDGHLRLKAAQKLGMDRLPVVMADELTDAQIKAFRLLANKSVEWSAWDEELLAQEFEDIKELDYDLDMTGFDSDDIDDILSPVKITEGLTDPNEVPEAPEETVTKTGDLWVLGKHLLLCGDSTDTEVVSSLLKIENPDLIMFDPPYDKTNIYNEIPEYIPNSKLYVFYDYKRFAIAAIKSVEKGWKPLYEFIWDCVTSWYTPNRPLARHKACALYGDNEIWNFDKSIIADGKKRESKVVENERGKCNYIPLDGAVHMRTVESFPTTQEQEECEHSKPVLWVKALIEGAGGDLVFDMFCGSGSILIACEMSNKKCYAMEIDPHYCDVIVKRWEEFTGKKAKLNAN